ncbi:hypothetical protein [Pedococcus bigeumensis]|uniref:hypothetical protein n=1 Tax=Pedococcus bigeumensis TaxID=433644 RepID=UPI0031D44F89
MPSSSRWTCRSRWATRPLSRYVAADGEVVAIPTERHALSAVTDAVVLLTVALH